MPTYSELPLHHEPRSNSAGIISRFRLEDHVVTLGARPGTETLAVHAVEAHVCKHCGVLYDVTLPGMCAAQLYERLKRGVL
jgi:hypothetical protein